MPSAVVVRYRTSAAQADENERLARAVFAELEASRPAGVSYAVFRLGDGTSFVHVATFDDPAVNPLLEQPAFGEFQRGISERCEEQPAVAEATLMGSYGELG
jgi:hypothetical protein